MMRMEQFQKNIEKWKKLFPKAIEEAFGNVRTMLVTDVQRNYLSGQVLGVRTGHLRASIEGKVSSPLKLMLGTPVDYGAIWFHRGRDFLNPSINKNMSKIQRMILESILKKYKETMK